MDRGSEPVGAPARGRHALPRPPSPRATRMDRRGMGSLRQQPPREVLQAHDRRAGAISGRVARVAPARERDRRRSRPQIGGDVMSVGPGWRRLFRISRDRQSAHRDVDDEIAFHLAMREEKLRRLGASPSEAEAAARARFGDPGQVRDECVTIDQRYAREVRVMEWIESVWSDIRYAFRTLRRMPAFTLVATLTLALGIGATTAMFTLVDEILLRPLPYPDANRIVRLVQ